MKKKIALTGMMGSGKTTVGKILANKLKTTFFDSDALIESHNNQSIKCIFQKYGEQYFRSLERFVILNIINKNYSMVISLGGGSFIQKEIRKKLKQENFFTVWLKAPTTTLIERLSNNDQKRPLISLKNKNRKLLDILKAREGIYAKADLHIDAKSSPTFITDQIIKKIT